MEDPITTAAESVYDQTFRMWHIKMLMEQNPELTIEEAKVMSALTDINIIAETFDFTGYHMSYEPTIKYNDQSKKLSLEIQVERKY